MGRYGPHGEYLPTRREIERWTAIFRKERDANDERESIRELVKDHDPDCRCDECDERRAELMDFDTEDE